ncbi:MAG TPA: metallophosphoesterase [Tepidisphaeraceae bacterium]|jgi:predicted phosphohydrolase
MGEHTEAIVTGLRLLVTADLHFNHNRSRPLAEEAIAEINATPGDVLLLVGDTAAADGDALEQALSRITFTGPKLFLCGNHELWTSGPNSYALFEIDLPRRVRELGWQWLETEPFQLAGTAIVGTVGWYDYSFAADTLGIPDRFYAAKISPGAAHRLSSYQHLLRDDVSPAAMEVVARWNDGKFVKLGRADEAFLQERIDRLRLSLDQVAAADRVIAAVHHVPFKQLLPPRHSATWDFARAYLGSDRLGDVLLADPRVSHVYCGHSHHAAEAHIGHLHAINIGSGYRSKRVLTLDV